MIDMPEKKRQIVTSLRVNADSWKKAKIEAIRHDITLTDLIEDAIELWIEKQGKKDNGK
jgi:hypothetical protein